MDSDSPPELPGAQLESGRVDGVEAVIDEGVEQAESRLFIDVPAEDIAAKSQGGNGEAGLTECAFDHRPSIITMGTAWKPFLPLIKRTQLANHSAVVMTRAKPAASVAAVPALIASCVAVSNRSGHPVASTGKSTKKSRS